MNKIVLETSVQLFYEELDC